MLVTCSQCNKETEKNQGGIDRCIRLYGKIICRSCSAKNSIHKKPQCNKEYWKDPEIKKKHSASIKSSDVYYQGIANRPDTSGKNNVMFGKKHSAKTKNQMSESRTGKTGENATAWKGGKKSLVRLTKERQHKEFNWYQRVYRRDGFKCVKCDSKKIEAHHINPMAKLIRTLLENYSGPNKNQEKVDWLITQPEIRDEHLENGVTLCRECHKKEHGKTWGSHTQI